MLTPSGRLYEKGELRNRLRHLTEKARKEVELSPPDYVLAADPEDFSRTAAARHVIEPPVICFEERWMDEPVDDSIQSRRGNWLQATKYSIHYPISGDVSYLEYTPSTFHHPFRTAYARFSGGRLTLTYTILPQESQELRSGLARDERTIRENLKELQRDIERHNEMLPRELLEAFQVRLRKVCQDKEAMASLGVPIRRREDAPSTHRVPVKRRNSPIRRAIESPKRQAREFAISVEVFDEILDVMNNMAMVMELSPRAFQKMEEPDLRWHFLVQLNGQFEGSATGESFSVKGRTDVQILIEGRSIFIAECKYWHGPKKFSKAIDQLFGYLSWRNTKAAILVFNRGTDPGHVAAAIEGAVKGHLNYLRPAQARDASEQRFMMRHPRDESGDLLLSVLVFDIPDLTSHKTSE